MASCLKFVIEWKDLRNNIQRLDTEAELTRLLYFVAARKIQSWYRGIITRNHIRMLNLKATVIQRHWLGFRGIKLARNRLIDQANVMSRDYYHSAALKIQRAWYRFRAKIVYTSAHRTKDWIATIYEKNKQMQKQMQSVRELQLDRARNDIERESLLWILFIVFKSHHLLGTKHRAGVLTSTYQTCPTAIENIIQCLDYSMHLEEKRLKKAQQMHMKKFASPRCFLHHVSGYGI